MRKLWMILLAVSLMVTLSWNSQAFELNRIVIQGFISQGYLKSWENNFYSPSMDGTFEFNEMGINFSTDIDDKLHMGLQFFANDLGTMGNDEVRLDWAYADYRWKDWLGFRVGKMKALHGLYNEYRDMDMLRTNILFAQGVYNESWRDTLSGIKGGGLYGALPLNAAGKLKYTVYYGIAGLDTDGGAARLLEDVISVRSAGVTGNVQGFDMEDFYNAKLEWHTPLDGLYVAASTWNVKFIADTVMNIVPGVHPISVGAENYVYSMEYNRNKLTLVTEYMEVEYDLQLNMGGAVIQVPKYKTLGYYGLLAYAFTDWFEAAVGYSEFVANESDKKGDRFPSKLRHRGWMDDYSISLRFNVDSNWILKLEGHYFDGSGDMLAVDQDKFIMIDGISYPDLKRYWNLFAAKVTYSF